MAAAAKTIADEMTEKRLSQVQGLVDDSDYAACALPHRQEVDRYLVDGIGLLVLRDTAPSEPKSWKEWWWEFSVRAPYAGVLLIVAILAFYYLATGSFPFVDQLKGVEHEAGILRADSVAIVDPTPNSG